MVAKWRGGRVYRQKVEAMFKPLDASSVRHCRCQSEMSGYMGHGQPTDELAGKEGGGE